MAVKIRLSRIGKKHVPFFRIVAVDTRKKRDGQNLENLGTYDPIGHKLIQYNKEGIDAWIAKGAQMTDTVKRIEKLYNQVGIGKSLEVEKPAPKAAPKAEAAKEEAPVKAAEEKPAEETPKEEAVEQPKEEPKAEEAKEETPAEEKTEDK